MTDFAELGILLKPATVELRQICIKKSPWNYSERHSDFL
ncbi:hypothetical protein SPONN_1578 [uncultured Candidatus Thioglobus sp.]|nr:hypothetical protein SPONL_906 [uncultured Candidatus Thioglobus sp.]SMN00321.1 hypothetical protein SPONN_1578 [uncultured Candidatus Thioglobus sp.]